MSTIQKSKRKSALLTLVIQHINDALSLTIVYAAILSMMGILASYAIVGQHFPEGSSQAVLEYALQNIGEIFSGFIVVLFLLAIAIVVKCFKHLHKKSIVDTIYSLPVTKDERYLSSCISSVVSIVTAFAVAMLITTVCFYVIASSDAYFAEGVKKCGLNDSDFVALLFHSFMLSMAETIFASAIATLAVCCCGAVFDSLLYTAVIAISPLFICSAIYELADMELQLFSYSISDVYKAVHFLSPLSVGVYESYSGIIGTGRNYDIANFPKFYLVVLAISAVLFAIAFFLHKLRRAEDIGTPVAVKGMQWFITALVSVSVACGIFMADNYGSSYENNKLKIMYCIVLILGIFAIEGLAVRKRKLNMAFFKGIAIRFAIIVPLSFAAVLAIYKLNVLSQLNAPDWEDVEYINVRCGTGLGYAGSKCVYGENGEVIAIVDENGNMISDGALMNSARADTVCKFKEQEQIKDIMAFVDECVETEREYFKKHLTHSNDDNHKSEYWISLYVTVYLKGGRICNLHIYSSYQHADEWARYYLTDELFDTYAYIDEGYVDDKVYSVDETWCFNE